MGGELNRTNIRLSLISLLIGLANQEQPYLDLILRVGSMGGELICELICELIWLASPSLN